MAYCAGTRSFAVHPALRQRIEASKADVGMATVCGHLNNDDFYVVNTPVRNSAPVVMPETIAKVTRSTVVKGPEALHSE